MLEALAQCGTAAFDKTGTLTTGQLAATSMRRPNAAGAANGAAAQHSGNGGEKRTSTADTACHGKLGALKADKPVS